MRRHHEEFTAAPAILPALSALIPISVALWARLRALRRRKQAVTSGVREPIGVFNE